MDTMAASTPAMTGIAANAYKEAFRRHPGGVAVITADDGSGPAALTLTSLASVSAEPPLLIFSVSDQSSATPTILGAESFVVHLISADEVDLARLAAAHGADRFPEGRWARLETGEPYYPGVANRLRCRIVDQIRAGASTVLVGLVLDASELGPEIAAPLTYHNRAWHRLDDGSMI